MGSDFSSTEYFGVDAFEGLLTGLNDAINSTTNFSLVGGGITPVAMMALATGVFLITRRDFSSKFIGLVMVCLSLGMLITTSRGR